MEEEPNSILLAVLPELMADGFWNCCAECPTDAELLIFFKTIKKFNSRGRGTQTFRILPGYPGLYAVVKIILKYIE